MDTNILLRADVTAGLDVAVLPDGRADLLAWYHTGDADLTETLVTLPATLADPAWVEYNVTHTPGLAGPLGGNHADQVRDVNGTTYRRMYVADLVARGLIAGPLEIEFDYRCDGAGIVNWFAVGAGTSWEVQFYADGTTAVSWGNYFPEDLWSAVRQSYGGGWYHGHIRGDIEPTAVFTALTIAPASWHVEPPPGDPANGFVVDNIVFRQRYATGLRDRGPNAAHTTALAATAPAVRRITDGFGYLGQNSYVYWPGAAQRYLETADAVLCAGASGNQPLTILMLLRRIPRSVDNVQNYWLRFEASVGNHFEIGTTAGSEVANSLHLYAGMVGVTGAEALVALDCETNIVGVVTNPAGTEVSIYLLNSGAARLIAGPTPLARGTMASMRLGVSASAVADWAIFGAALSVPEMLLQATGIASLAGGQSELDRFEFWDGTRLVTRSRYDAITWADDFGILNVDGVYYKFGGAEGGVTPSNAVHKSEDNARTWTLVPQVMPFPASMAVSAWLQTVAGVRYVYVGVTAVNAPGLCGVRRCPAGVTLDTWEDPCPLGVPWATHRQSSIGFVPNPDGTGTIYHFGGQSDLTDWTTATNAQYRSDDGGASWVALPNAPWSPRMGMGALLPLFKARLRMLHGGQYAGFGAFHALFDDQWSFEPGPDVWTLNLLHTPFVPSAWVNYYLVGDDLVTTGGIAVRRAWRTEDFADDWTQLWPMPLNVAHAASAGMLVQGELMALEGMADNHVWRFWSTRP